MIIDKDNIKILLIILILGLGIGYAYINSDININGTAQVNSANWDVHWANIQVTTGSVSASSPTISNGTTVNYSVVLNTPGDYYEFTVDAVNGGTIDAMIDTISSKLNGATITTLPDYLKYKVTYNDGVPLSENHQLLHNTTETYKVKIEYRTDIEVNQLPATDQTLNLQFTVTYRQATDDSTLVRSYLYEANKHDVHVGDDMSTIVPYYTTYQDVVNNTGHNIFVRHLISNNKVVRNEVGFIYNNNAYYLIGDGENCSYNAVTDSYDCTTASQYYEQNKQTLQNVFGSSNCSEGEMYDNGPIGYSCYVLGFHYSASSQGNVSVYSDPWTCGAGTNNSSGCEVPG